MCLYIEKQRGVSSETECVVRYDSWVCRGSVEEGRIRAWTYILKVPHQGKGWGKRPKSLS